MNEAERVPTLGRASFYCPNCGAFTSQSWYTFFGRLMDKDKPPYMPAADSHKDIDLSNVPHDKREKILAELKRWRDRIRTGEPLFGSRDNPYSVLATENLYASLCFTCETLAIWIGDKLVFPPTRRGIKPVADTPDAIRTDFDEARSIIDLSPRGAAALLRLAVQKLCVHLGEPGKDLNKDIGSLVTKGLPPQIQQALDIVRVIGNEAVHPGELDLKDDHDTAERLMELINMIVDDRIARPKQFDALYARLPQSKRDGIEQRDAANRKRIEP